MALCNFGTISRILATSPDRPINSEWRWLVDHDTLGGPIAGRGKMTVPVSRRPKLHSGCAGIQSICIDAEGLQFAAAVACCAHCRNQFDRVHDATTIKLTVNGRPVVLKADDPSMPLLYALRDQLGLHGLHFGCGLAQCGACTVHYYGEALRSCVMPVSAVAGAEIVTLEGLGHGREAASACSRHSSTSRRRSAATASTA